MRLAELLPSATPVITGAARVFGSLFFGALAFVFLGLAVLMAYEVLAIWTRQTPTISLIVAFEFLKHPRWGVVLLCGLCFAVGALVTHVLHWTP